MNHAFILVTGAVSGECLRVNVANIGVYRATTADDGFGVGTVIALIGGNEDDLIYAKETVREIDAKISRLGSTAVEYVAGVNI